MLIVFGEINADGTRRSGTGFTSRKIAPGQYEIAFRTLFRDEPAVTGSQTNFGNLSQNTLDNVVFPFVDIGAVTALTGTSNGTKQDRNFSIIAIGEEGGPNPKFKE